MRGRGRIVCEEWKDDGRRGGGGVWRGLFNEELKIIRRIKPKRNSFAS